MLGLRSPAQVLQLKPQRLQAAVACALRHQQRLRRIGCLVNGKWRAEPAVPAEGIERDDGSPRQHPSSGTGSTTLLILHTKLRYTLLLKQ